MKAIFLIAGHGLGNNGTDNGASFNGTTEYKEVSEIVSEAETFLLANSEIAKHEVIEEQVEKDGIMQTQRTLASPDKIQLVKIGVDERLRLKDKIAKVNAICIENGWSESDACLVSVHVNAAGSNASGAEIWYETGSKESEKFAKKAIKELVDATGFKDRGTKDDKANRWGRLGIIRDTKPVAILAECGFITNDMNARMLKDPNQDDKVAAGIAMGVFKHLKINERKPTKPNWFTDVPEGVWYEDSLKLCVQERLVEIPTHGRFNPTPDSTRMVTMMARHLQAQHNVVLRT